MDDGMIAKLEMIVSAIGEYIDIARAHELHGAARFLAMAKLDLQMNLHGISEEELAALCSQLDANRELEPAAAADVVSLRSARERRHAMTRRSEAPSTKAPSPKGARVPGAW